MSSIGCALSWLSLLQKPRKKFQDICAHPEEKANTAYFGISAIIASVISCGLILLCVWGITALAVGGSGASINDTLKWALVVLLAICALFLFAEYIFGGLISVVYQFRCNLCPISWIALVVFLLTAAAMAVGLIFIIDATGV